MFISSSSICHTSNLHPSCLTPIFSSFLLSYLYCERNVNNRCLCFHGLDAVKNEPVKIELFDNNLNAHDDTPDNGNDMQNSANIIRIRGLPWNTTITEICDFFKGVNILHGENGVHLITLATNNSKPLGEAYIELATNDDFELAKTFHKKNLGTRYIEGA